MWVVRANLLAWYSPERAVGSIPASATLMEIPTRRLIQQKNLFSVDDCALKWHPGKSGAVSVYHAPVLIAHVSR